MGVMSSICMLVGWLVGDYSLSSDFGPYGIIFMNVCLVITVSTVMLLRDFGRYVVCQYVG
jgi:hypothetical protein